MGRPLKNRVTALMATCVQAVGASSPEGTLLTTSSAHQHRALLKSGSSKALEGGTLKCDILPESLQCAGMVGTLT